MRTCSAARCFGCGPIWTATRWVTDAGSAFFGAVDRIRRKMDDALLAGTASEAMIDRWEQTTAAYGTEYMTAPPLRLLCDTLLDLSDVRRMCAERQPVESAGRLCGLAGGSRPWPASS